MTERDLIKNLRALNEIKPNQEFARVSRSEILSPKLNIPIDRTLKRGIFSRGVSFAVSLSLATVFMLLLAIGGIAGSLKTFLLPTLQVVNNDNLVSEADTITNDIDIRLNDIEYFGQTKQTVAFAEPTVTDYQAGENEIDRLLNEVIDY